MGIFGEGLFQFPVIERLWDMFEDWYYRFCSKRENDSCQTDFAEIWCAILWKRYIVWERTLDGDKKRTPEERDKEFDKIIKSSDWIVEGSPRDCLRESFDCCDYIIILNEKTVIRLVRVKPAVRFQAVLQPW